MFTRRSCTLTLLPLPTDKMLQLIRKVPCIEYPQQKGEQVRRALRHHIVVFASGTLEGQAEAVQARSCAEQQICIQRSH